MEIIRLKLFSGNCKVTSSLSRTLGQYQINTKKFCDKFNTESSQLFLNNCLFYIFVYKQDKDVYSIKFGNPSLKFLIICFLKIKNTKIYNLNIIDLYNIFKVYNYLAVNNTINIKNFFGSLSSFKNLTIKDL